MLHKLAKMVNNVSNTNARYKNIQRFEDEHFMLGGDVSIRTRVEAPKA